jgi:hypothetical protein
MNQSNGSSGETDYGEKQNEKQVLSCLRKREVEKTDICKSGQVLEELK